MYVWKSLVRKRMVHITFSTCTAASSATYYRRAFLVNVPFKRCCFIILVRWWNSVYLVHCSLLCTNPDLQTTLPLHIVLAENLTDIFLKFFECYCDEWTWFHFVNISDITILSSAECTINWAKFQLDSARFKKVGLVEHVVQSWADMWCRQCRPAQE